MKRRAASSARAGAQRAAEAAVAHATPAFLLPVGETGSQSQIAAFENRYEVLRGASD